jgi:type I restriction enzyme, S subunit
MVLHSTCFDRHALLYALLTDGFIKLVDSSTFGSKMPRANWEFIGNCILPIAPPVAQQAIVDFLNHKTDQIDTLIRKKEELIEKLQEKRSALIARTVTRGLPPDAAKAAGLNPHPKMKNSGIEWLGEIPEHWEVLKTKWIIISRCDGPFGSALKTEHYSTEGVRVIRLQNIRFAAFDDADKAYIDVDYYKQLGDHSVFKGDLLVAGLGDENHSVGRACVAPEDLGPAMVKADCFRFRLDNLRADSTYLALQFSSAASALGGALATGTTRSRMNLSQTSDRIVALPPLPEQTAIANYLDRETTKIDQMIEKVKAAIEKLREYRSALITAAVTGKIDVRNYTGD